MRTLTRLALVLALAACSGDDSGTAAVDARLPDAPPACTGEPSGTCDTLGSESQCGNVEGLCEGVSGDFPRECCYCDEDTGSWRETVYHCEPDDDAGIDCGSCDAGVDAMP